MKSLLIVGAAAMGREVFGYALEAGLRVRGFLDDRVGVLDGFGGYPPIVSSVADYRIKEDDVFVCAVGDPAQKMKYAGCIASRGGRFQTVVHPSSYVGHGVSIGDGCIVAPHAVVSNDTRIAGHVIVNDAATVGHDNEIGEGCTISPGCHLAGRVKVGNGVFVGIGASVIPDVRIDDFSVVGAGAVVVRDVAARTTVVGVPARPLTVRKGNAAGGVSNEN